MITIHMRATLSEFISQDNSNGLSKRTHRTFSDTAQVIYRRNYNLFSFLNPVFIYHYIIHDWKTLLDIPPLVSHCTFITENLLMRMRWATIISNSTFPFLPPIESLPIELLSLDVSTATTRPHMLIIMLTSTKTKERFDAARNSWIQHLIRRNSTSLRCIGLVDYNCIEYFSCCLNISQIESAKLIVVGDDFDQNRGIITLPQLERKASYLDAQHRQLQIMKYIIGGCERNDASSCLLTDIRWIGLIDDDTWLNVEKTLSILSVFDWKRSIAIGHILTEQEDDRDLLYVAGGGGIFLTQLAFVDIATNLYQSCPFCKYNDVTIGACAAISNVQRLHIPMFLAFRPSELPYTLLSNVATIHYMDPSDMINSTISLNDQNYSERYMKDAGPKEQTLLVEESRV